MVAPGPADAAVGGVTRISDRQESRSCDYARARASGSKRQGYAEACRGAAAAEHRARIAAAAAATFTYENPVYGTGFPDPGALRNGDSDYYAYATGGRFPIIKSPDLVNWEQVGHAFSARPSWVVPTGDWHPWAPSVLRSPRSCPGTDSPGCYFMYYVGLSAQHTPTTHCVGVAWSLTPSGPFTDLGLLQAEDGSTDLAGRPPGCGDVEGYSNIDPAPFVDDDGTVYLYVSTGRRCAEPTMSACPYEPTISVLQLTSTPTKVAAARKPLFGATPDTWEQEPGDPAVVENPWVEKRGDVYYLFYSGGSYRATYGMGYATASSPTGGAAYSAFEKSSLNPILAETADVLSPGGGSVTTGPDGGSWLVYHGRAGTYTASRTLRIDPLTWSGTGVSTIGPTTGPQSWPSQEPSPPQSPPPGDGGDPPANNPESSSGNQPPADQPASPTVVAPTTDLAPPSFGLAGRRTQRARRTVVAIVRAPSEDVMATSSGRVRLGRFARTYRLRGVDVRLIARGETATIRLTMSKRALLAVRRALSRGRRVTVTLTVAARDMAGNVATAKRTIRLTR